MIVAENLSKSFGTKRVLCGLSFTANRGEITLLLGANGAGKTTTMRLLTGLARPNGGSATIAGHNIVRARESALEHLSFLPQNPNFHPRFTCAQIVRFYARFRGVTPERQAEVLRLTGLADSADLRTGALSGGMRQRLGLAILLLPKAPVLLLDEPGISLDPGWRKQLQDLLREEARTGATVLISTHLIAEWNKVAHRALYCSAGSIERELDPENLPEDFGALEARESKVIRFRRAAA